MGCCLSTGSFVFSGRTYKFRVLEPGPDYPFVGLVFGVSLDVGTRHVLTFPLKDAFSPDSKWKDSGFTGWMKPTREEPTALGWAAVAAFEKLLSS